MDVFNDPTCRAKDRVGHVCTDSHGNLWCRPGVGPRQGTHCFFEAQARLADVRARERSDVADVRAWLDGHADDADWDDLRRWMNAYVVPE